MSPPAIPTIPAAITARGEFGFDLVNWALPTGPTIDSEGRIAAIGSTKTGPSYLGFTTVYLNGTDYTFFRNQIAKPIEDDAEDPGGDGDCRILFPQVTALETLGTGALADFVMYANVETWLAVPADATQYRLFQGSVKRWAYEDNLLVAYCRGAWRQLDDYVRMPAITDEPAEIGQLASGECNHTGRPHLAGRLEEMATVTTGIESRYRGDGGRSSDYLAKLYSIAWDAATGDKWTGLVGDDRTPETVLVADPQVDAPTWVVDFGAEGVDLQVEQDGGTVWNVAYLGGQDPGGQPLDSLYPLTPNGVFHMPGSSQQPDIHNVVDDGSGNLVSSGSIDPTLWRIETLFDFGAGVGRPEAVGILDQIRTMLATGDNWSGQLTLNGIDPKNFAGAVKSKFLIRPNDIMKVRWFFGSGSTGMKFRVAQVRRNYTDNSVQLVIDTKRRDIHWLEAIANQVDVRAKNPIARLNVGTDAGQRPASKAVWDTEKSGWIPNDDTNGHYWADDTVRWELTGNAWNVLKFLAAEAELFYRFEFHLDENQPFHVSLYNMDPTDVSHTVGLPADPFADPSGTPETGPWTDPKPDGFINGWGQKINMAGTIVRQAAGFYPLKETADDGTATTAPETGDFVIIGDFSFDHDEASAAETALTGINEPAYLWVAVWVPSAGTFHGWGRMVRGQRKG